jgi:hypothetical protein
MAQKDLVIGVFSNYTYDFVKPWIKSIKETGFKGDVVLYGIDVKNETLDKIKSDGVIVFTANSSKNDERIHMQRFLYIYDYLKETSSQYRYVVSTDVRDVIFQLNPSEFFNNNEMGSRIITAGEAIRIRDEEWNRNNILVNFGEYFYEEVKDLEVQNVGILAGAASYMKDLCFALYQMSLNRPDWVADQAAYNMLVHHEPWKSISTNCTLQDCWATNAAVTNQEYQNVKEKYKSLIMDTPPILENGQIVHGKTKRPFYIVHQYDRVREWKKFYEQKYDVKIESHYTPDDDIITIRTA